jgi:2-polyprenyl-3-methyl-5-hydroxy-6-metoxy-1,4-benzoquinol methylase
MPDFPYDILAPIYDSFQSELNNSLQAERIHELVCKFGPDKGDGEEGKLLVCDLGCGSGSITLELARKGYDMIGVDQSSEMLLIAQDKFRENNIDGLFLCQDITRLDLFGTVDVFVCLTDTVNHLTGKNDFSKLISGFRNFLNPGGLFIFDTVTLFHMKETLGNQFFHEIRDDYALLWQNSFSKRLLTGTSEITLFRRENSGTYSRKDVTVTERYYSKPEIEDGLIPADMELLAVFGDNADLPPRINDVRHLYVAKRRAAI